MKYYFSHVGVPDSLVSDHEEYVEQLGIYRIDGSEDPMAFEYTNFLDKSFLPEVLKHEIHIGYEVDDLEEALRGEDEVLLEPYELPGKKYIAIVRRKGVLVELIYQEKQYEE